MKLYSPWMAAFTIVLFVLLVQVVPAEAQQNGSPSGAELKLEWRYVPGGLIKGPVVAGPNGSVYFQSDDWYLYRIAANGKPIFRFDLKAPPGAVLCAGPNGSVIASTAGGDLVAVTRDGRELWRAGASPGSMASMESNDSRVVAATVTRDGLLLVAYRKGALACYNETGRLLWNLSFTSRIASMRATGHGVLVSDNSGRLYRFDDWGNVQWEVKLSSNVVAAAADNGLTYAVTEDGSLEAIGGHGGTLWRRSLEHGRSLRFADAPALLIDPDGDVLVTDAAGRLHSYRPDGTARFTASLPDVRFTGCVAGPGGLLYATTDSSLLVVMNLDGTVAFTAQTPEPAKLGTPWLLGERQIISDAKSWVVYAFEARGNEVDRPLAVTSAADATNPDEESLPLSFFSSRWAKGADYVSLRDRIEGHSEADRESALRELASRVMNHRLRASLPYVSELLARIVAQPFLSGSQGRRSAGNTLLRSEAATLLGYVGDTASCSFLTWIIEHEYDAVALSAEIEALSRCRVDADHGAEEALMAALQSLDPSSPDPRVGEAVVTCLASIRHYSGALDERGVEVIDMLLSQNYSIPLRRRALGLLH